MRKHHGIRQHGIIRRFIATMMLTHGLTGGKALAKQCLQLRQQCFREGFTQIFGVADVIHCWSLLIWECARWNRRYRWRRSDRCGVALTTCRILLFCSRASLSRPSELLTPPTTRRRFVLCLRLSLTHTNGFPWLTDSRKLSPAPATTARPDWATAAASARTACAFKHSATSMN